MNDKLKELREKANKKPFYQFNSEEKIKYFSENIFNYNDLNIPYKNRRDVVEKMRRDSN